MASGLSIRTISEQCGFKHICTLVGGACDYMSKKLVRHKRLGIIYNTFEIMGFDTESESDLSLLKRFVIENSCGKNVFMEIQSNICTIDDKIVVYSHIDAKKPFAMNKGKFQINPIYLGNMSELFEDRAVFIYIMDNSVDWFDFACMRKVEMNRLFKEHLLFAAVILGDTGYPQITVHADSGSVVSNFFNGTA